MKKSSHFPGILLILLPAACIFSACNQGSVHQELTLFSPDSSIHIRCGISDSLAGQFQYSVWFHDREIIRPSGLGIDMTGMDPLSNNLRIITARNDEVRETWDRVWGKRRSVTNHYKQLVLEIRETRKPKRLININFRVYNDGVALRYEIPVQKGLDTLVLTNDRVGFRFTADHAAWATFWNTFHLSQEMEFRKSKLSDIKPGNIIGTPLLIHAGDNAWVALLEANVTDWACSGLIADPDHEFALLSRPSWLPDDSTVVVRTSSQRFSPWKVMMIADQPGRLVESDILQNLNEPCALNDV